MLRKEVYHGEIIPKYYGIAWREFHRDVAVAYPIPFNIAFSCIRDVYIWFMHGRNGWLDKKLDASYNIGYDKGYKSAKALISLNDILTYLETHPRGSSTQVLRDMFARIDADTEA